MGPVRDPESIGHDHLYAYMQRELHPETASEIGRIAVDKGIRPDHVLAIIVQLKLDHARQDKSLDKRVFDGYS